MLSKIRWMVVVPAVAVAICGLPVSSIGASTQFTGAIWTTTSVGTIVNENHYKVKEAVYLNGGPQQSGGSGLPVGTYYFQVTDSNGRTLLSTDNAVCRQLVVGSSGKIENVVPATQGGKACQHMLGSDAFPGDPTPHERPVQLFPFSSSKNGLYKVWLIAQSSAVAGCNPTVNGKTLKFPGGCAKTDNFQVDPQTQSGCAAWADNFDGGLDGVTLDLTRWQIVSGRAPGAFDDYVYTSTFDPGNVSVEGGYLKLRLTQGFVGLWLSSGALIRTVDACGYGTYEWRMRMGSQTNGPSSTGVNLSGGVSAGLTFWNNSQNEIVFEHSAHTATPPSLSPKSIWFVNFLNKDPANRDPIECDTQDPPSPTNCEGTVTEYGLEDVYNNFHVYRFVWAPGSITFYVDDMVNPKKVHTTNVPTVPGQFLISYFGRNFANWGGLATDGTRYFFVDRVSFTPPVP